MGLQEYKKKRRFDRTPEPSGEVRTSPGNSFVIQKHRATRLHYDFRLEMEGVLRSWAIPRGPSLDPAEKRLAVLTEDHPMDYGGFEGVIPAGNYGAGNVIIWDRGTYRMIDPDTPEKGWKKGKLHFILNGEKLHGEWVLVRGTRSPKEWIFFKVRDEYVSKDDITDRRPESVVSGLSVEDVGSGKKTAHWFTPVEQEMERFGMKARGRTPMPKEFQPMLATLSDKPFDGKDWIFELKLDGVRTLMKKNASKVELWSRSLKSSTSQFPAIAEACRELHADSAILDGEIVALDAQGRSRFHLITPRLHLTRGGDIERAEQQIPAYYHVFDVLYLNGFDLRAFPLIERKAVLRKLIPQNSGWVRFTDHIEDNGIAFTRAVEQRGLEGVVAKLKTGPYIHRRSRHWLKIKTTQSDAFVIGGFTEPNASRSHFGALVIGLFNSNGELVPAGGVGSGFDERGLADTYRRLKPLIRKQSPFVSPPAHITGKPTWVEPVLVCQVKFNEWTPDGSLRAPVFLGFRDDVEPADCALEEHVNSETLMVDSERNTGSRNSPSRRTTVHSPRSTASRPGPDADVLALSRRIEFTNLSKIFWPEDSLTKGDLIRYYDRVSEFLVPHLKDRPLILKRYPDGIHAQFFFQQDAPDYTPAWVRTQVVRPDDEPGKRYFIGATRELLLYLANLAVITQNPWSSRIQDIEHPDHLIFDLDPKAGVEFSYVQNTAVELKKVLDDLQLRAFPKTSGATGMHVFLPLLEGRFTYEDVRLFAEAVASIVVRRIPEIATIERVVGRRKQPIYIDILQNVLGKSVASVYSPRAEIGGPVSTPLRWEELRKPIDPKKHTMRNLFDRLEKYGDLFAGVLTDRQDISAFLGALRNRHSRGRLDASNILR